jgi:prepilin-type N-terminal cleavage/methylation domain-containing protein
MGAEGVRRSASIRGGAGFSGKCTSRDDRGAVTLLELMVVIGILAILAAISIPIFLNQRGKALDRAAEAQMRDVGRAAMEGMMVAPGPNDVGVAVDEAIGMNMPVVTLDYAPGATSDNRNQIVAALEVTDAVAAWSGAAQPRPGRCTTVSVSEQLGIGVPVTSDVAEDGDCQASGEIILALRAANYYACRYNPNSSGTDFPSVGGVVDGNNAASCPNSMSWNGDTLTLSGAGVALSKPYDPSDPNTVQFTDGILTANLMTSGLTNAQYNRGVGVAFRVSQGPQGMNGMVFQLDQTIAGGPSFVVRSWNNGVESGATRVPFPTGFQIDGSHEVQIKTEGSQYTAYVNGEQIMTGTIPSALPPGSQFGIRRWGEGFTTQANGLSIKPL